jgi:hypothetical protein
MLRPVIVICSMLFACMLVGGSAVADRPASGQARRARRVADPDHVLWPGASAESLVSFVSRLRSGVTVSLRRPPGASGTFLLELRKQRRGGPVELSATFVVPYPSRDINDFPFGSRGWGYKLAHQILALDEEIAAGRGGDYLSQGSGYHGATQWSGTAATDALARRRKGTR